jgi:hypothetical protein
MTCYGVKDSLNSGKQTLNRYLCFSYVIQYFPHRDVGACLLIGGDKHDMKAAAPVPSPRRLQREEC